MICKERTISYHNYTYVPGKRNLFTPDELAELKLVDKQIGKDKTPVRSAHKLTPEEAKRRHRERSRQSHIANREKDLARFKERHKREKEAKCNERSD